MVKVVMRSGDVHPHPDANNADLVAYDELGVRNPTLRLLRLDTVVATYPLGDVDKLQVWPGDVDRLRVWPVWIRPSEIEEVSIERMVGEPR